MPSKTDPLGTDDCQIDWDIFPLPQNVWDRVAEKLELSPRHKAIVQRLLHGRSRKQVVQDLNSTEGSIGTHFKRLFKYHNVAGRDALILLVFRVAVQELVAENSQGVPKSGDTTIGDCCEQDQHLQ